MQLLKGALVVDGTGSPGVAADVVIDGTKIVDVLDRSEAGRPESSAIDDVVDLDGLVLAPGFIDSHTHYDAQILWDADLTPSPWHGVTTAVLGNCGFGIAPTLPEHRETIARTLENVEGMALEALMEGIPWSFETFPEYLDAIDAAPTSINTAVMIGHTPLRLYVMGDEAVERPATADEVARMKQLVGEAIDAGAIGFATSKAEVHVGAYGKPVPSRLADPEEIFEIAEALGERGRGAIAMTRGSQFGVSKFAELSSTTGRPLTWTALVSTPDALDVLDRQAGLDGDVWPQIACRPIIMQLTLADPGPLGKAQAFADVMSVPHSERLAMCSDPEWQARAKRDFASAWGDRFARMSVAESERHPDLIGRTLAEIADERGADAFDVLLDISLSEELRTRFDVTIANDDEVVLADLLRDPRTLLGLSDAGAHASQLCDAVFSTHLLAHWVRDEGVLSLEQAIWRLTDQPAQFWGFTDRGRIAPGYVADLVAFDPDTVAPEPKLRVYDLPAGADRLLARSNGIEHVWVNGTPIRSDGADLPNRPGTLLRSAG